MRALRSHPYRLGFMLLATAGAAGIVFTSPLLASQPGCIGDAYSAHIEVVDQQRGHLPIYTGRDGALFVEGTPGNRYQVLVCNPTGRRVLAVVSVDGVNVVSGETAGLQQGGYVVDPGGRMGIAGWRKSTESVAAFYFTSLKDSYAGRTGRPENVGVIGAAFFNEKSPPPPILYEPQARARKDARLESGVAAAEAPAAPSANADSAAGGAMRMPAPAQKLGTGHGETVGSSVRTTTFDRESSPMKIVSIRYESRQRLIEMGLVRRPLPPQPATPNPFPGSFVPDPPVRHY